MQHNNNTNNTMDDKDISIDKDISMIDKILSIADVEAFAISSLDGKVLQFGSNRDEISESDIKRDSMKISQLFSSYSVLSINISSLYLDFNSNSITAYGFSNGFIYIINSNNLNNLNAALLKMEVSHLKNEFIKIVEQSSLKNFSSKNSLIGQNGEENSSKSGKNFDEELASLDFYEPKITKIIVPLNIISDIKNLLSSILGPISSVIFETKLKDINEEADNFNVQHINELISLLSLEIEDKNDRLAFINGAKDLIKKSDK